ncbi:hypothetical protein HC891_23360, partial [Candidatus Gracilibacteria bacterium]|nr:hypothetical protein [Candidatus Gracilibacteria bacterium]
MQGNLFLAEEELNDLGIVTANGELSLADDVCRIEPQLSVLPLSGLPGTTFTVDAVGFAAGEAVQISLRQPDGRPYGLFAQRDDVGSTLEEMSDDVGSTLEEMSDDDGAVRMGMDCTGGGLEWE